MMSKNKLALIFGMVFLLQSAVCFGLEFDGLRSGIEFTLDNASLVYLEGMPYLSLDVMLRGQDAEQSIGTGIVYLNYNPEVFGEHVKTSGNVIVQKGALLTTSPLSAYNLILNDNTPTRLAITYEYMYTTGAGNILDSEPQSLLNICFKILNYGSASGISFQENLMQGEQYMDDNVTMFIPVTASDLENNVVPIRPEALLWSREGNTINLSWQECPGCVYTVYSSADPLSEEWQIQAQDLSSPYWEAALDETRMFFRVTASGLAGQ